MRHLKRSLALVACLILALSVVSPRASLTATKPINVKGYITNVTSPTTFEIDYYKVSRDDTVKSSTPYLVEEEQEAAVS
jgi:hypothetical protein